jgi:hypothetical protein
MQLLLSGGPQRASGDDHTLADQPRGKVRLCGLTVSAPDEQPELIGRAEAMNANPVAKVNLRKPDHIGTTTISVVAGAGSAAMAG